MHSGPGLSERPTPVWKRAVDVALAGPALLLLTPILVLIALVVRLSLGSPVLFRQLRPGKSGDPFEILKFRTMRDALDAAGSPLPDGDRLTRLGRFLRSTSLDELPELWNVLRGDMSLVGPRPLLMEYIPLYTRSQMRRHEVLPGLTGWAQINGRNALSWEEKFRLDLWYVDNSSPLLDAKIILLTIWTTMRREGIRHGPSVTMPRFRGSVDAE
jgi:lipopolysaccharide/colanic/teichoic acid biosynthesis glycosyltransferase